MTPLDEIKNRIQTAMKSQGTYSADLDLCIEICAGSCLAFQIALRAIEKRNIRAFIKEVSREGNSKLVAHPVFKVFFDASESARKQLRELGLTLQTVVSSDDDEVNQLINDVEEAGKDE